MAFERLKRALNAFTEHEETYARSGPNLGPSSNGGGRSWARRFGVTNERSILTSIYTRISIDVAGVRMRHVQVDDDDRYTDDIKSKLNLALNFEPNLDQGPRHFRQDVVDKMIQHEVAAIVAVDTSVDQHGNVDIYTLRVGRVLDWRPKHVQIELYNERTGRHENIWIEKQKVAIVENPLGAVMNGPSSTLQRLGRKLSLLDNVDEVSSGRLDMIIQLPYAIKSEALRERAESRRKEIEFQLKESQYGIAYADGTEKITQLNRPLDNQLMKQVEYLTTLLYSQLGITAGVMEGTASEAEMLNYRIRTVEPMLDAIQEAMQRAFIGPFRYLKGERILYFSDPFKLVPLSTFADIADKLSRNEVASPNELRGWVGLPPSKDPKADLLVNSNMPQAMDPEGNIIDPETDDAVMSAFDEVEAELDQMIEELGSTNVDV